MSRYIDAEEFYASQVARCWGEPLVGTCTDDNARLYDEIQKFPAADVAEVRHGRNVTNMHPVDEFICSECGLILRDLTETRIDEENEDECYFEFECRDCKWWTKQEDSAQGRCELCGFYPTGEWYCANGERKEYVEELKEMKLKGRRNDTQGVI